MTTTASAGDRRPYASYNAMLRLVAPIYKSDGTLITSGTASSKVSTDEGTAGTGAVPVQVATTSGLWAVDLTASQCQGSSVDVLITTDATGAVPTALCIPIIRRKALLTGTARTAGSPTTSQIQLATSAPTNDGALYNMDIWIDGGTGIGQIRRIVGYTGSTRMADLDAALGTATSTDTTYQVLPTAEAPHIQNDTSGTPIVKPQDASIVTATFGTCVPPAPSGMSTLTQTQVTGGAYDITHWFGAKGGLPMLDASTGLILTGYGAAATVTYNNAAPPTAASIATTILTDALTGSDFSTGGSFGKLIKDNLDAAITSRSTYAGTDTPGTATLVGLLTAARAGYLDNLNVGGAVASHADIAAINQSASKHLLLQTVGQYERPESGSTVYTIECRTFAAGTGAAVNADTTPTLAATGQTTGDLSSNLGAATNPATGVYRWTYSVASTATNEPIRFDVSATIATATFTLSAYSQVVDEVAATWTATDASHLTSIYNKLPTNNIADETLVLQAVGTPMQAGTVTLAASQPNYAPAKAGDAMTLTNAYDAAKTAAPTVGQIDTQLSGTHGAGAWGSNASGTGANTVTLTITDTGAVSLENVSLSAVLGGVRKGSGRTNASGVVVLNLDNGTYTIAMSDGGAHTFAGASLVVNGDTSRTYVMDTIVPPAPSNPVDCACAWLCLDDTDSPVEGAVVYARPQTDATGAGIAWSGLVRSATSGSDGLAVLNLPQGSTWWVWRGDNQPNAKPYTVPSTSTASPVEIRGGVLDAV